VRALIVSGVITILIATIAHADLVDLGRYGPTCPVPDSRPPRSAKVRLEPGLARVGAPVEPSMLMAAARRTYVLAGHWPVGMPPIIAFVGQDAASLALVRALPPGTPVFVLPSEGGIGLDTLRRACPACRIGIAGPAGARALGIQAVPAVIRMVDGVVQVTEGAP
jgi:hypothetical protein